MRLLALLFTISILLTQCKTRKETADTSVGQEPVSGRRMDNFTYLRLSMQGNFSSEEQSKNDSDYFDIRLRMVPIWEQNDKQFYLYVEQAMSTAQDKPYRQRIYRVVKEDDNHFTSYIYLIPNASAFIGKTDGDPVFKTLSPDSLKLKDGCEVRLTYDPVKMEFNGSTGDKTCPSDRSGAAWATSKVTINDQGMISWDQGWDDQGKQVWGAVKGGYIFRKNI